MNTGRRSALLVLAVASLAVPARAAAPAPAAPASPLSATASFSAGHDSNLYLVERGPLASREDFFTSAGLRLAYRPAVVAGLELIYAPSYTRFFEETDETHARHELGLAARRSFGATSVALSAATVRIDGADAGPTYAVSESCFASAVPRERRDQWQNRADLAVRRDLDSGLFIRAVGKLAHVDMLTRSVAGAKNYRDRHDVSGGLDLGRRLGESGPDIWIGHRFGRQFQDRDAAPVPSPTDASNRYQRPVLGFEGRALPALKIKAEAGRASHDFSAAHNYAGGAESNLSGFYADLAATWTAGPDDELVLRYCRAVSVSATSTNATLSDGWQLTWKHVFSPAWSATLGAQFTAVSYDPSPIDDSLATGTLNIAWRATSALTLALDASHGEGRNTLDGLASPVVAARRFDRTQIALSATLRF